MIHDQEPALRRPHARHPLLMHCSMRYTALHKLRILKTAPRGMICMLGQADAPPAGAGASAPLRSVMTQSSPTVSLPSLGVPEQQNSSHWAL